MAYVIILPFMRAIYSSLLQSLKLGITAEQIATMGYGKRSQFRENRFFSLTSVQVILPCCCLFVCFQMIR